MTEHRAKVHLAKLLYMMEAKEAAAVARGAPFMKGSVRAFDRKTIEALKAITEGRNAPGDLALERKPLSKIKAMQAGIQAIDLITPLGRQTTDAAYALTRFYEQLHGIGDKA